MLVLGDAHADDPANRRALLAAYRASDASVALQAGDLMHYDLPIETYFIGGNNEDFDVIEALRHGRIRSEGVANVHLLASTAETIRGIRVGGLTGNYAPSQFYKARSQLETDRRRHFVNEDVERAKQLGHVDVLLTHESPHGTPVEEDYDVGCTYIDDIIDALDPALCLVGHHHEHTESTFGQTRVVTLDPVWEAYYDLDPETLALTRHAAPRD
jgi:Icc-related predicted phosphoesterase